VPTHASRIRMARTGKVLSHVLSSLLGFGAYAFVATADAAEMAMQKLSLSVLSNAQERHVAEAPGSEFRECARVCPRMVVVPPGTFAMGSPEDEVDRTAGEGPRHEVTIAHAFAISRSEVTFEQWDACVAAAACPTAVDSWGRGTMPVIDVSWDGAKLYVAWLSHVTGKEYRLPTEAEWEYAARAGSSTRYAWGDEPGIGHANCNGCVSAWTLQTAPVGSFQPNAFGLFDMQGNVWEWVEDVWHDSYEGAPTDGSAWIEGDATYRVVRGASWHNEPELTRVAIRFKRHREVQFDTLGFRVARTIGQ
jgi:formylglycine-generating enzyme required for sulfatase activity